MEKACVLTIGYRLKFCFILYLWNLITLVTFLYIIMSLVLKKCWLLISFNWYDLKSNLKNTKQLLVFIIILWYVLRVQISSIRFQKIALTVMNVS